MTTQQILEGSPARTTALTAAGVSVERGQRTLLHHVDLSLHPGEVVAIAGASGSGKTTLLRVIAGLQRPTSGVVVHAAATGPTPLVGFVPQDDIVHRELPVRSTLRYSAALRLPDTPRGQRDDAVDARLEELDLADRREVPVGSLSGGQRKRVSIAVELLRRPRVLLLDEPTSGLDPTTAAEVMATLRRLADSGVAVALATHREADIESCDRVVFLRAGRVVLDDQPAVAMVEAGVDRIGDLYRSLEHRSPIAAPPRAGPVGPVEAPADALALAPSPLRSSARTVRQAVLLARRSAAVMARNRLTLAVLLGSPLLVTAMMATLFPAGAFDGGAGAGGLGPAQLTFWLAFAGFFFGLTYGLLQVVGERPVLERERFAGLRPAAYVASKVLVLAPFLVGVAAMLLFTLRALDRLPALRWAEMAGLLVLLVLESLSALALGLVASSAVRDAAQATLALPMICFPQVLFAGAVVPVVEMTAPGRALSTVLANRWAFEALGRQLRLDELPAGAIHGSAFIGSPVGCAVLLVLGTAGLLGLACTVVRRTTPAPPGSPATTASRSRRG